MGCAVPSARAYMARASGSGRASPGSAGKDAFVLQASLFGDSRRRTTCGRGVRLSASSFPRINVPWRRVPRSGRAVRRSSRTRSSAPSGPRSRGERGILIDIHFRHLEAAVVLARDLLQDRSEHPAGPHQGAQKSTSTGWVDCETSVSNVVSVTLMVFIAFSLVLAWIRRI